MKFVQITATTTGVFALDEIGRVWVNQPAIGNDWRWLGWKLLGDVPDAQAEKGSE